MGPEHEFSIIGEDLEPLPISDKVIKRLCGRIRNNVQLSGFVIGKELQKHVAEIKPKMPFKSPLCFEEAMQEAIIKMSDTLETFGAKLLGTGMHPTLSVEDVEIWNHRDKRVFDAFSHIFDLKQHGWLNIQSFQLNLPYYDESQGVHLHNTIAAILPYLPAISASSPIYESRFGEFIDNRLKFYWVNQARVPSITGDIVPEFTDSFKAYCDMIIRKYSADLMKLKASPLLLDKEWVNSRGVIFRFDRKAIEIRVMDEQESIKSDVALSSFIRALLRGLERFEELRSEITDLPHSILVENLRAVIRNGLEAEITHPKYPRTRDMCLKLYDIAYQNASEEEKKFLWIIKKRIENGNLSEVISEHVKNRAQRTDFDEAIVDIYSKLADKLTKNDVYE